MPMPLCGEAARGVGDRACFSDKNGQKSAKKAFGERSTVLMLLAAMGFEGAEGGVGSPDQAARRRGFPQHRQWLATNAF
jgi:hypothetical protein